MTRKQTDFAKLEQLNKDVINFENIMDRIGHRVWKLTNEKGKVGKDIATAQSSIRNLLGYDKRPKSMMEMEDEKMRK